MAKLRKGKNPQRIELRRLLARKDGPDRKIANEGPARRVIEFPKSHTLDDVVSDRIIFEVGGTRFAIKWTAEIEQLPARGPIAVERKKGTEEAIQKQLGLKQESKNSRIGAKCAESDASYGARPAGSR
jgi:hypothetical protein